MEKFIYRLAFVNDTEIEDINPYYFADKKSAFRFVETFIGVYEETHPNALEKISNIGQEISSTKYVLNEPNCYRILNFEPLYKDNSVQHNRYLAITSIPLVCIK